MRKRTRKKITRRCIIAISTILIYGAPFTQLHALEPERIRTANWVVVAW